MVDGAEVVVLANPGAGRGRRAGVLAEVFGRLRAARLAPRLLPAASRQEALESCRDAVAAGPAAVLVVGGDGTVHLALQAVAGTSVPLGVVPVGTGNDFAATLGFTPARAHDAAAAAVAAIREGRTTAIDLARATHEGEPGMWYGTVLSAGLDSSINERANRMRWPKGPRRYDLSILVEIARLAPRDYRLVLDGTPQDLSAMIIAVGNGTSYGGGLRICPNADVRDGLLELTIVGPIGRGAAIRLKGLVRKGTHLRHPAVSHHRVRTVEIHGPALRTYADGERGLELPVRVECVPGAVTVLA